MAKDYNIAKTSGQCIACGTEMPPGGELTATVSEQGEELQRQDYCLDCWNKLHQPPASALAVWRTQVPRPQEKKKLFVDNDVLVNLFERLDGAEDQTKLNFRFVLALVLMRKKLLAYEGMSRIEEGREVWKMRVKGSDRVHEVVDPHMDEEKIAQVSQQLGEILEGEL